MLVCNKYENVSIRFSVAELAGLLKAFYSESLSKDMGDYIQGCKGISYEAGSNGPGLTAFVHQNECKNIMDDLARVATRRGGRSITGYHEYVLWCTFGSGDSLNYPDMPKVRGTDIKKATETFAEMLFIKLGNRFKHG